MKTSEDKLTCSINLETLTFHSHRIFIVYLCVNYVHKNKKGSYGYGNIGRIIDIVRCLLVILTPTCRVSGYPRQVIEVDAA
jgi:hypothetical protein